MNGNLESLVDKALSGDKQSLEKNIENIKTKIYNLSLRMLWNPIDAEDATQEILIKIITNLSSFKKMSKFTTWVYRIASNYLLTVKKRNIEKQEISFELFEKDISYTMPQRIEYQASDIEKSILVDELKIGCTNAMLLCLNRPHRLVFILNIIFHVNSRHGAIILGITPEAFRKRLSRSRAKVRNFMNKYCCLVNPNNPCKCSERIGIAIKNNRIDPANLLFTGKPVARQKSIEIESYKDQIGKLDKISLVFRSNPYLNTPGKITKAIKKLIDLKSFSILNN